MSQPDTVPPISDSADAAAYIVDECAADNKGVAEVMPADRIDATLEEVVAASDAFDGREYDALLEDVKDAVLDQGVTIV